MAMHNVNPVREQLRSEMLAALAESAKPMTSSALYQACPSAVNADDVARVAYELKRKGVIADGGKVIHALGMPVNSYVLASQEDPRIEASKPIKVERKIPKTGKANRPRASNPYAQFSISKPQEAPARVTRDLPQHLQSSAPQMAAEAINQYIEERIMSEDPIHYMDIEPFALGPKEPEAQEDIDSDLVSALIEMAHQEIEADSADDLLAKMAPLPLAEDDDDVLAMASADVGEIAAAMGKAPKKVCKCLRINSLPPLPKGYAYGGIKVWIESEHDVGRLTIATHDEGGGAFASIKASGLLSFDPGDLVAIGQVADALIRLHEEMSHE